MTVLDLVKEKFLAKNVIIESMYSSSPKFIYTGVVTRIYIDGDDYCGYEIYFEFYDKEKLAPKAIMVELDNINITIL